MNGLNKNLTTPRTLLRKYAESDKEIFAELFTDKEVNFYMGGEHCETKVDAYNLFDKTWGIYNGSFPGRHFEIWAIEFEKKVIGHFELKQTNHTNENELEIVYLLDKNYWGRGLIVEIISGVNVHAKTFGKQLIATINPENTRTVRALEKTGIEKQEWTTDEDGKVFKVWIRQN